MSKTRTSIISISSAGQRLQPLHYTLMTPSIQCSIVLFRSAEKIAFSQFEHLRARCLHVCWVRACVRPCSLGVCSSREVYGEIFESNFFMSDCAELDVTSSVRERETWPCKLLAYLGK